MDIFYGELSLKDKQNRAERYFNSRSFNKLEKFSWVNKDTTFADFKDFKEADEYEKLCDDLLYYIGQVFPEHIKIPAIKELVDRAMKNDSPTSQLTLKMDKGFKALEKIIDIEPDNCDFEKDMFFEFQIHTDEYKEQKLDSLVENTLGEGLENKDILYVIGAVSILTGAFAVGVTYTIKYFLN